MKPINSSISMTPNLSLGHLAHNISTRARTQKSVQVADSLSKTNKKVHRLKRSRSTSDLATEILKKQVRYKSTHTTSIAHSLKRPNTPSSFDISNPKPPKQIQLNQVDLELNTAILKNSLVTPLLVNEAIVENFFRKHINSPHLASTMYGVGFIPEKLKLELSTIEPVAFKMEALDLSNENLLSSTLNNDGHIQFVPFRFKCAVIKKYFPNLTSLNLNNCLPQKVEGVAEVGQAIAHNFSKLQVLKINNNYISTEEMNYIFKKSTSETLLMDYNNLLTSTKRKDPNISNIIEATKEYSPIITSPSDVDEVTTAIQLINFIPEECIEN